MRTIAVVAVAAFALASLPASLAAPPTKAAPGTIVIVFKDGHRQAFNLADIAHIDFGGVSESGLPPAESSPARGQFVGRWIVGVGAGSDETFEIQLKDDGNATRSLRDMHGTWQYVNGEARITWDDGAKDAIRKVGSRFQKYAYTNGQSFTDKPDNVTSARNTTPKPI